jgi:hypothetical protein
VTQSGYNEIKYTRNIFSDAGWTRWINHDHPSGTGDWENLYTHIQVRFHIVWSDYLGSVLSVRFLDPCDQFSIMTSLITDVITVVIVEKSA